MAEETIIIRGGSVEMEFGTSLAPKDSNLESQSPLDNKRYICEDKNIRRVLVTNEKGEVELDMSEATSDGLKCEIRVEYS